MPRSYLASEENFALIKDLQSRNLVVPVVGNFAGPKAIRAVGKYLRAHGSAVRRLLRVERRAVPVREGGLEQFCASVATLPLDDASTFIRSERGGFGRAAAACRPAAASAAGLAASFSSQLRNMLTELKNLHAARVRTCPD